MYGKRYFSIYWSFVFFVNLQLMVPIIKLVNVTPTLAAKKRSVFALYGTRKYCLNWADVKR